METNKGNYDNKQKAVKTKETGTNHRGAENKLQNKSPITQNRGNKTRM